MWHAQRKADRISCFVLLETAHNGGSVWSALVKASHVKYLCFFVVLLADLATDNVIYKASENSFLLKNSTNLNEVRLNISASGCDATGKT